MGFGQRDLLHPRHSQFEVVFGQHLDAVEVVFVFLLLRREGREFRARVGPHDLLAQIDAVDDAAVKAKDIEIHPARAGRDHQGVDALIGDVLLEQRDPFLTAQARVGLDRQPLFFRNALQGLDVQGFPNATTFADVNTILLVHE